MASVSGGACPFQAILKSRSRRAHRHKSYCVSSLTIVDFDWQNICPVVAPVLALHVQHAEVFCFVFLDPKSFGAIGMLPVITVFQPSIVF